jgi:hypothetical protein
LPWFKIWLLIEFLSSVCGQQKGRRVVFGGR